MRGATITRVGAILRLTRPPAMAAPAIVMLGLTAAALEGAGLSLFIPLVQGISGGEPTGLLTRLAVLAPWIGESSRWIPLLVAGLCVSIIFKNVVGFAAMRLTRIVEGQVAHRLRLRVFEQTLRAGAEQASTGAKLTDIANLLASDTWKVAAGLSLCYRLMICLCTVVVFLALLSLISLRLTAIALLMAAVSGVLVHLLTRNALEAGAGIVEENKRFGLRMWESIYSLPLIRSFGREGYEAQRLAVSSEALRRRILQVEMAWSIPGPVSEILGAILIGGLIVAGVRTGAGLGALAAFLAILYRMQSPLRELLQGKVMLEGLDAAISGVDAYLAATAVPLVESGAKPAPPLVDGIRFQNVSFRYAENATPALSDVSFVIPAGRTTALVGRSGAGKSTVLTLLLRFRDPDTGQIVVDDLALRDLDLASWRGRLSYMFQEAQLFNDTVAANIAYGDLDAGPEAVIRAARAAGAWEFIETLPEGLQTLVGDRGARLSGGQKQRIALARTVLRRPDLLLLDEPTNALDVESELAFQSALETFSAGRTVVVVAHRLSTVQRADQVVVLEEGRVVEIGSPAELLARPGQFARMHGLQTTIRREVA